jgi:hypothetical protein
LNVVRYASQALLAAACEATLPRCSNVPHIFAISAAKQVENSAEVLILPYTPSMAQAGGSFQVESIILQ